jgi:hypothetical protein
MIHEQQGSPCKNDVSTDKYKNIVSRNAPKSFTNVGNNTSLLKGITLKEMLCEWK